MSLTPSKKLQLADMHHLFKDDLSYQAFVQSVRDTIASNEPAPTPILIGGQVVCHIIPPEATS